MTTAVVTVTSPGRIDHVRNQVAALERSTPGCEHVVAALSGVDAVRRAFPGSTVLDCTTRHKVNLARARNAAGDYAAQRAATVVFLDADCIPGSELVRVYEDAAQRYPGAVVSGPVTYLRREQTASLGALDQNLECWSDPHPARPVADRAATPEEYSLFWSLSFAMHANTWTHIRSAFGGFDEAYEGYGGEDTDFGWQLRDQGIPFRWVSGAEAFHQWHPVSSPPWEHIEDILLNGARFRDRWGIWPMQGWLHQFAEAGAIRFHHGEWELTDRYEQLKEAACTEGA